MEKWNTFIFYNKRDVEVEMSIQDKLKKFHVPDFVWDEYHLDQEINDRGIALDMAVVENAIAFDAKSKAELAEKMQELTDLDNPNSVVQMKQWLSDNGLEMDSLGKKEVAQAVKTAPKELAEVLQLRQGNMQKGAYLRSGRRRAYSRHSGYWRRLCTAHCSDILLSVERGYFVA